MTMSQAEYEVQLYGFTTNNLCNYVSECLHGYVEDAIDGIARKMKAKYDEKDLAKFSQALAATYKATIDSHFSGIKDIVQRHFTIPPEVLLSEDEIHAESDDEAELDRKIEADERRLIAMDMLGNNLAEIAKNVADHIETMHQSNNLESTMGVLSSSCDELAEIMSYKRNSCLIETILANFKDD